MAMTYIPLSYRKKSIMEAWPHDRLNSWLSVRSVRLSKEFSGDFRENALEEWSKIWYAVISIFLILAPL